MNKQELYMALYHRVKDMELSQLECECIVTALIDIMQGQLKQHKEVKLVGFGTLKPVRHKARAGHNPKTGKPMKIPAKTRVKFKQHDSWSV